MGKPQGAGSLSSELASVLRRFRTQGELLDPQKELHDAVLEVMEEYLQKESEKREESYDPDMA